jgi:hypothetical protein
MPAAGHGLKRFVASTPSGAEASSGLVNVRRSKGRGVEEATGTPRGGTSGNLDFHFLSDILYIP